MKNWTTPNGYIEKKYNYTYKLTFKYDERYYYYGVHSSNIEPKYDNYSGSGSRVKDLKKEYGNDCFIREILEFFPTKKEALLAEDKLVPIELLSDKFCLNKIQGGGTFDTTGLKMTEEEKKKISERFKNKKRTEESIKKMVQTRRLRGTDKHSDETRQKISKSKIGSVPIVKNGQIKWIKADTIEEYLNDGWIRGYSDSRNSKISENKMGEKNAMYGKHWSQEQKNKMIEAKIKNGTNFHSEETKQKLAILNRAHAADPEFCKHLSECCKGVNVWSKGRRFIHNLNGEIKSVKAEELETYLNDGWILGRPKKKENI